MLWFDPQLLMREFSQATLGRARVILQDKKIISIDYDEQEKEINAQVVGSYGERYEQFIHIDHDEQGFFLDGDCTCPVGYNCKHIAAVLIQLELRDLAASHNIVYGSELVRPVKKQAAKSVEAPKVLACSELKETREEKKFESI